MFPFVSSLSTSQVFPHPLTALKHSWYIFPYDQNCLPIPCLSWIHWSWSPPTFQSVLLPLNVPLSSYGPEIALNQYPESSPAPIPCWILFLGSRVSFLFALHPCFTKAHSSKRLLKNMHDSWEVNFVRHGKTLSFQNLLKIGNLARYIILRKSNFSLEF